MSAHRKSSWFHVRPAFLIAGAAALMGFGAIVGIGLDLATRPSVSEAPQPRPVREQAHASRSAIAPIVVAPDAPAHKDSILQAQGDARRAWAPDRTGDLMPDRASDPISGRGPNAPLVAYAMPSSAAVQMPALAIVIDDLGLDHTRALATIALAGPLTLSLMTYAPDLADLAARAHAGGHELLAHVPMEPRDAKERPGPGALLTSMDEAAVRRQLASDLDGWSGYVGINNHMGSRFTADRRRMAALMDELRARGLMWLDSKTIGDSSGPAAAEAAGVPFITRDVFLDNVETVEAVMVQLERTKAIARSRGVAVAIGHPHDATIAALRQWLPTLPQAGVALVPATEVLRRISAKAP